MRYIIAVAFALILGALGSALFFLMKDKGTTNRTATLLAWRVGLSIALFLFILLSWRLGWIQPHGVEMGTR